MKLSVIIPVYNEIATIEQIIDRVLAVPLVHRGREIEREIVVVDDGSIDGTRQKLAKIAGDHTRPIKVIFHDRNRGKGAAIRTALEHVTGDLVIVQDADLEYCPEEFPALIAPILDGRADVVYGSRFRGPRRTFMFSHHIGNKFLTFLTNLLYNTNLTDMETCYKVFRTEYLKAFDLRSNRFDIEPEITAKVFRLRLRVHEVPISYDGRSYEEGKKITWRDGLVAVWTLLRWRFWVRSVGEETLRRFSKMQRFNRWIYDTILPHLGMRIFEAGCGTGNLSAFFRGRDLLYAVDISPQYIERLKQQFAEQQAEAPYGSSGRNMTFAVADLADLDTAALREKHFDTVVCINVLEHIEDDRKVLRNFFDVLEPGGKAIVLVPAFQALFCNLDRSLGHHRRYSRSGLTGLFREVGFEVIEAQYHNIWGLLGWFINGKLLRRRLLPSAQMSAYESLVPFFRIIERAIGPPPVGLSLIVVGRKPQS